MAPVSTGISGGLGQIGGGRGLDKSHAPQPELGGVSLTLQQTC